jgi:hypothetical protein
VWFNARAFGIKASRDDHLNMKNPFIIMRTK